MRYTHIITKAWAATLPPPDGRPASVGLWVDASTWRNTAAMVDRKMLVELTASDLEKGPPEGMGHPDGPRPERSRREPPPPPAEQRPATPPPPPPPPEDQRPATLPDDQPPPPDQKPAIQPTPTQSRDDVEEARREGQPRATRATQARRLTD